MKKSQNKVSCFETEAIIYFETCLISEDGLFLHFPSLACADLHLANVCRRGGPDAPFSERNCCLTFTLPWYGVMQGLNMTELAQSFGNFATDLSAYVI